MATKKGDDYGYYYAKPEIDEPWINILRRSSNSALLLFLALIITTLVYEGAEAIACLVFKYNIRFYFSEVKTPTDYHDWSRLRVFFVYLAGPVACLLVAVIMNSLYHWYAKTVEQPKLLVMWLLVCLVNIVSVNMIEAPLGVETFTQPFYRSFAIIGAWMFLKSGPLFMLMLIGVLMNIFMGYFVCYRFLEYSNSSKLLHHRSGKNYMFLQVFVWPIFMVFPLYVTLANNFSVLHFSAILICLLLFGLGFFIRTIQDMSIVICNKNDVLNKVPVVTAPLVLITWLIIFLFLK